MAAAGGIERGAVSGDAGVERDVRRNTLVLAVCLALGWSVPQLMAALSSVTFRALTDASAAGFAPAVFLAGSAVAGIVGGRVMDRFGRRVGIRSGVLIAAGAALIVSLGTSNGLPLVFLLGLAFLGLGFGCVNLARAAAADMYPPQRRGRGIAYVLAGAAVGAIASPIVFRPILGGLQPDDLAGLALPWLPAIAILLVGAAVTYLMRVDPMEIGQRLDAFRAAEGAPPPTAVDRRPVIAAIAIAATTQAVMSSMMTLAALILVDHGHDLASVSVVISAHFLGMFALVLVVGRVVDRFGRVRSLVTGLLVLALGVLGFLPGGELLTIMPGMFLIGLGWNLAFVAATALLADAAPAAERAQLLGLPDFIGVGASALLAISGAAILDVAGVVPVTIGAAHIALAPLVGLPLLLTRSRAVQPAGS